MASPRDPTERVRDALRLVERLERLEPTLPSRSTDRPFVATGRVVVAAGLDDDVSALVPPSVRARPRPGDRPPSGDGPRPGDRPHSGTRPRTADGSPAGSDGELEVSAPVAADVLALAKFDLRGQAKLRAHYVGAGLTLAVAPVPTVRGARDGGLNAQRAHEVVSAHAPGLLPRKVAHGSLGRRVRYLVEEWVDGTPVLTRAGLAAAAPQILDGLAQVHRGHGVRADRLSARWGEGFHRRWEETRACGIVPHAVGERVSDLVAADRQLRISWTHGDLVASNVLRTPEGAVILVDWEHSHEGVIMLDAAKLHLFSAEPEQTLDLVLRAWAHDAGAAEAYTVVEEMLLAHARLLSRYPTRRVDLEGHPRAAVYEEQVRRQVVLLEQVFDRLG